ncbi:T9SS type A sorting domain-containing protein [Maribacter algarum]|uniref:T9SS type A sorting domain-containing protein n=1 Tax=Maribacter algarum (ex Zhang et al. 2020) TaxID=2578118 RepID=A0A5S3PN52_9FLAO|nr:Ig-like domain-containing protein [Maribacter algarum]TMM55902.1 T9SS type A sorting domain-containing protein [Maribacter algarum]
MKTKQPQKKIRNYLLVFSSLILLSAVPYFAGPGIQNATPIGAYLNGVFPSQIPTITSSSTASYTVVNAFPNLTFIDPVDMVELPNSGEFLVLGLQGHIWKIDSDESTSNKELLLDISDNVVVNTDGGMLGLTLHPDYGQTSSENGEYIYVFYRYSPVVGTDGNGSQTNGYMRLSRFNLPLGSNIINPSSEQILINIYDRNDWHNGGDMFFGPEDGFLYLSLGDEGGANDNYGVTQQIDKWLFGGVLRIDVDRRGGTISHPIRKQPLNKGTPPSGWSNSYTQNYYIPNDNPWQDTNGGILEEFYAIGTRSPHRMTIDPPTGDIWIGDIGQHTREEVSLVRKGDNLQWPYGEGDRNGPKAQPTQLIGNDRPPIHAYDRSVGTCVIGGFVYRGSKFPELNGKYLFGDQTTQNVWTLTKTGENSGDINYLLNVPVSGVGSKDGISSFFGSSNEDIYILDLFGTGQDGAVIRKVVRSGPSVDPPQKLSDLNVFTDLQSLTPIDGLVPYDVNAPLWSDGAEKRRWIALTNDGNHNTPSEQIHFEKEENWSFPPGTVAIKQFDLPTDENDPSKVTKLETRFLVFTEDNDVYGVTYKWNDEQTDAFLIGIDEDISQDYSITKSDGSIVNQTWNFPNRSQCIQCHNSVAGYSLGLKTRQLNKSYTYPSSGITSNQLETWNHLNMFSEEIEKYTDLPVSANINSESSSNEMKVRSYIDANCAFCHRPNGVEGAFDGRSLTALYDQLLVNTSAISHASLPGYELVVPQDIQNSLLYLRDISTEADRMPPIGRNMVDEDYMEVLIGWIEGLDIDGPKTIEEGLYTLQARYSSNFMAVSNASNLDDASVVEISSNLEDHSNWYIEPVGNKKYRIRAKHSGLVLSLSDLRSDRGANVIQEPWNGDQHQLWYIEDVGDEYTNIVSVYNGLVLNVSTISNEEQKPLNLWTKDNTSQNQQWKISSPPIRVTGVTVSPLTISIVEGDTQQITMTITPDNATNSSITWSSSDDGIATVNVDGLVTAVAEGTATITVTTTDGGFTATSLITVDALPVAVTGVSVSPQSTTLLEGASQQLIAAVSPSNANDTSVIWSSSDNLIATVSMNGTVTGISTGAATITATTNDGNFTDTSIITVEATPVSVSGVSISNVPTNITIGLSEALTATVAPSNATNTSVDWSSNNTAIATVDISGLVTAIAEGTAIITVTSNDGGFTDSAAIDIVPDNSNLCNPSGTILMERYDGISGSAIANLINAPNYPDSPSLSSELTLFEIQSNQGDNYGVSLSGYLCPPETGVYYFWIAGNNHTELNLSTSEDSADKVRLAHNEDYALSREWNKFPTQKSQGVALTKGNKYYIEALMKEAAFGDNLAVGWRRPSEGDGASPTEVIPGNVMSPVVRSIIGVTGISSSPNLTLTAGETAPVSVTVSPSNATDTSVSWSSNNNAIATVDVNGLVTAMAEGTATITVITNDGGFTDTSVVNVVPDNPNSCTASGTVLMERYDGISGSAILNLINAPNYPDSPTMSSELTLFEIQSNQGDNYGVRVSGYLCPPETGTYYFWIAGNNHTELNLSTSDNPTSKVRIAHNEDYALNREWNKFPTQKSQGIVLTKGNNYYIEALMKEAAFGDNLSVGWRKPSDGNGASPIGIVPGNVLSPAVQEIIAVSGVSLQPSSLTLAQGETGMLTPTIAPLNSSNRDINWSSNDDSVATVDSNGLVTALAEGTATITITTEDGGFTDTSVIDVVLDNPNSCTASGTILMERYDDITGSAISNLVNAPNYPDSPSISAELPFFETPRNMGDNYGVRVSGYLCPPETGIYYFWIAGNNHTELNLSTSDDPANKVRLAHNEDYALNREWNKFPSQKSQGVLLTKGNDYYIEALMKEAAFGDNLAVGWRKPSDGNGASPTDVIPGSVISPVINSSQSLMVDISDLSFNDHSSFTISPNPASTEIQIIINDLEGEDSEIEYLVYSITGSKIMHLKGGWNQTIDVSRLAKGAYQIIVRSGPWSESKKLIVR